MSLRDLFIEIGMEVDDDPLVDINKELDELTKTVKNGAIDELEKDLKGATKAADDVSRSVNDINREVRGTGGPLGFFKRTVDGIKDTARSGLSKLGDGFRNLPGIVGGAAMKVGSSVTNFITAPLRGAVGMIQQYAGALGLLSGGALATSGMARLSAIENAEVSLRVMMGSAEKAKGFLDEMLAFARTTPFAFPDLAETSRNLIAFGMDEAKVIPTMKAIGDAAAASGKGSEGLRQIASAFGAIQVSGTLSLGEVNRLMDAGIPALKILANTTGKSVDQIKKDISSGMYESAEAIDMLVKGMQEGTSGIAGETAAMAGIMEEMKSTWTGSVDSLKASISSTMAKLLEPIKPHIQEAMAWFGSAFSKLPGVVFGAYEAMKPGIDAIKEVIDTIYNVIMSLYYDTGEVPDLLSKLGLSPELVAVVSNVLNSIRTFFANTMANIGQYTGKFKESISNAFEAAKPSIVSIISIIGNLWDIIVGLVEGVVMPLIPVIYDIIVSQFTAMRPVIDFVAKAFEAVKSIIMILINNVIMPLIPIASSIIQTAFNIINPILRIAKTLFGAVIDVIMFLVNNVVKPLIPVIVTVLESMWIVVKPILDALATTFDNIADAIEWAIGKFKEFKNAVTDFKMPSFGLPKWMGGNGVVQFGSHATGLGRVPYDGYMAELHKNESVLTAEQSNALRSAGMLKGDGVGPTLNLDKTSSYQPLESSPSSTTTTNNRSSSVQASINIVVKGSDNPKETARSVKEELEDWFDSLNDQFPVVVEG